MTSDLVKNGQRTAAQFVFGYALLTSSVAAQGWLPADAIIFDKEGTVAGVAPNALQMVTKHKANWLISISPQQTQVKLVGTALPSFLHTGLFVRFPAEIDEFGHIASELKELEIYTPAKPSTGVYPRDAAANTRPLTKIPAGNYEVRGKVLAYDKGNLYLLAGKKYESRVAADAKIAVNSNDISWARPEDSLKVVGYYYKGFEPSPSKGRPGRALGKQVEITLAKPLTTPPVKEVRRRVANSKGKERQTTKPQGTSPVIGNEERQSAPSRSASSPAVDPR